MNADMSKEVSYQWLHLGISLGHLSLTTDDINILKITSTVRHWRR
jgi:hypothetical protein